MNAMRAVYRMDAHCAPYLLEQYYYANNKENIFNEVIQSLRVNVDE